MDNIQPYIKAVAAGIAGALIAELSRYGFHPAPVYVDAIGVLVTGVLGYVVAHVITYLAPANKPKVF